MFHPLLDAHSMNYYGGREGGGEREIGIYSFARKEKKKN